MSTQDAAAMQNHIFTASYTTVKRKYVQKTCIFNIFKQQEQTSSYKNKVTKDLTLNNLPLLQTNNQTHTHTVSIKTLAQRN